MADMFRVRVVLAGWSGAPGLATHYFLDNGAPDDTPLQRAQEVAERVQAAWAHIADVEPTLWTATVSNTVDVLAPTSGMLTESYTIDDPDVVAGAEGGGFGPEASGICVNWNTGNFVNGKRVRGRTFISPTNNGMDSNGTPTTAHLTKAREMAAILMSAPDGYPDFVVWHRPVSGAGGAAFLVTGSTVKDTGSVLTSRRA